MGSDRRRMLIWGLGGLVGLGILGLGLGFFQPRWLLTFVSTRFPGAVYFAPGPYSAKAIALTIDDGPSPETTPLLLDLLAQHQARATFFVISDRIPGQEQVLQRMVAEGHEVGNHTTQDYPSIRWTAAAFEHHLLTAEAQIQQGLQSTPTAETIAPSCPLRWFRPGSGFYSATMIATAERHGYRTALGSVFPYDTHIHSAAFALAQIKATIQAGDILVLHDGQSAQGDDRGQRTQTVLAQLLPWLTEQGYQVVTLSELFAKPNQD